jgi:hypothetical protein
MVHSLRAVYIYSKRVKMESNRAERRLRAAGRSYDTDTDGGGEELSSVSGMIGQA